MRSNPSGRPRRYNAPRRHLPLTCRLSGTPVATRSASLEHKFDPTTAFELHPLSPADLSPLTLPPASFARDIETRALPPSITSAAISPRDPGGLETVPGSPSPSATATPPSSVTENPSPLWLQSSAGSRFDLTLMPGSFFRRSLRQHFRDEHMRSPRQPLPRFPKQLRAPAAGRASSSGAPQPRLPRADDCLLHSTASASRGAAG